MRRNLDLFRHLMLELEGEEKYAAVDAPEADAGFREVAV